MHTLVPPPSLPLARTTMRNDAVRRIMAEVKELRALSSAPDAMFVAAPLDSDLFEWHFSVRGPPDTAFASGVYHGRILLPPEYPLKAPEIMLLTPNGRFELNTAICLSVTAHHQETWQPSWGIRTILTALIGFMPSAAEGLGALDFPDHERRKLALRSHSWSCPRCGAKPAEQLPPTCTFPLPAAAAVAGASASSSASASASASVAPSAPVEPQLNTSAGNCAEQASAPAQAAITNIPTNVANEPNATPAEEVAAPALVPVMVAEVVAAPAHVPVPAAAPVLDARSPRRARRRRATRAGAQEQGLLYAAYAIVALIAAIIARRVL